MTDQKREDDKTVGLSDDKAENDIASSQEVRISEQINEGTTTTSANPSQSKTEDITKEADDNTTNRPSIARTTTTIAAAGMTDPQDEATNKTTKLTDGTSNTPPRKVLSRIRSRRISFKSQPSTTSVSTDLSGSARTDFRDEYSLRSLDTSNHQHQSSFDEELEDYCTDLNASFRKDEKSTRKSRRASTVITAENVDADDPCPSTDSMRGSILSRGSRLSKMSLQAHRAVFDSDVNLWQRIRTISGYIVRSGTFQISIIILIALNALTMGLVTFDFVSDNPDVTAAFEIVDFIFLVIFTIELVLQLIYNGTVQFFGDGWLVFDFIVVVLSWGLESFQIVRAFRIFRAFRLIARLDVLRKLVQAIIQVIPRMYAISALLMLINYIYAVLCTELFYDLHSMGVTDIDYFSTIDKSLFTLFQMMTLDWSTVSRQVQEVYPWAWSIFSSFVLISAFIVYNLIVAVVCEAVSEIEAASKKREKEEEAELMGKTIIDEREFREEQLMRIRLMRSQLSHLISSQNDILKSARFSLEGADGMTSEVSSKVLNSQDGMMDNEPVFLSVSARRRSTLVQPPQREDVPSYLGGIEDQTDDSISIGQLSDNEQLVD